MDGGLRDAQPKIALFVEYFEGFGHFNVVSQLARALRAKGAEVAVFSSFDNGAEGFDFGQDQGVELIKLPKRWNTNRSEAIRCEIARFKPNTVLFEFYPFLEQWREADLNAVQRTHVLQERPPTYVSLCRDIVHNANAEASVDTLNERFDHVLVRGDQRFSALSDSEEAWQHITKPIQYMGNFVSPMPVCTVSNKQQKHVVVSLGGGISGLDAPFLETVIRSRKHSEHFSSKQWDVYVNENEARKISVNKEGRCLTLWEHLHMLAEEEGSGKIVVHPNLESSLFKQELSNAAVVVTRAGYNTTFELHRAGVPQLVIPRRTDEQLVRAHRLFKHGMASVFPPSLENMGMDGHGLNEKERDQATCDIEKSFASGDSDRQLGQALDTAAVMKATALELNNNGVEATAETLMDMSKQRIAQQSQSTARAILG